MSPAVQLQDVSKRYRSVAALDHVDLSLDEQTVHGLLGRNGAGKTTLLKLLAGHDVATGGQVHVFGEPPYENESVLSRVCFVSETQRYPDTLEVGQAMAAAALAFPHWDAALADELVTDFELPAGRRITKLSRGMRSAVGIIIGLAARAPLTCFDEPYMGLDAVARQLFYDRLLAEIAEQPRTVVLSTHLIDEVADLIEHVVIIDHGRILLDENAEALRARAVSVAGPAPTVERFAAARPQLHREDVGSFARITLDGGLDPAGRAEAASAGLEVEALSLQQLMVRTTAGAGGPGDRRADEKGNVMNRTLRVARLHTYNWPMLAFMPWGILAASFAGNVLIIAAVNDDVRAAYITYGLVAIDVMMFVGYFGAMTQWLPFAMGLGVTRSRFFAATVVVAMGSALAYALALLLLSTVEARTDGWGLGLWFFAPTGLASGGPLPQFGFYAAPLFTGAALGLFGGVVQRRWGSWGTFVSSVVTIAVSGAAVALVIRLDLWSTFGDWLGARSSWALWGGWFLAVAAVTAGAYGFVRRVTP